jgi:hypothetical protein
MAVNLNLSKSFHADVFNLKSPLFSLIPLNVSQHRSLTAIGQKKASCYSLVLTINTCNQYSEKS